MHTVLPHPTPSEMMHESVLDDWRREQPDVPTRPEALRRLAEQAVRGR